MALVAALAAFAVLALEFAFPKEIAEIARYALPAFIVGLALNWRCLLTATGVAFCLSATNLALTPEEIEPSLLVLDYGLAATFTGAAAFSGWYFQYLTSAGASGSGDEVSKIERFLDLSLDFLCVAGLDGNIRHVNNSAAQFLDRTPEELVGTSIWAFIHDEDRADAMNAVTRVALGSDIESLRIRMRRADGEYRLCEWTCPAMTAGDTVFCAAGRDVTERARAEETLRLLASIVECSEDAIVGVDLDGHIRSWNPAAERIYGFTAAEALGKSVQFTVPENLREESTELVERLRGGGSFQHVETTRRRKDGRLIDVSLTSSPIRGESGEIVGASVSVRDITAQKRDQRLLLETQQRLERAIHGTYDGLWEWNVLTNHMWFAPRFREMLGFSPDDEFPEQFASFGERLHPGDYNSTMDALRKHLDAGCVFDVDCRLRCKSGEWRWFRMRGASIYDPDGVPRRHSGSIRDVSDIKQMTQTLIESEERIRLLLNCMGEGIYGVDTDGNCTFCNPAGARILGYDDAEYLLHRQMHELVHQSSADGSSSAVENCKICGALHGGCECSAFDEVFRRADGTSVPVEYRSFPIVQNGEVTGAVVTFRDISDQLESERKLREKEEELRHSQRMEAVGHLAGGVAHEYNNLLQAITGYTRFAQQSLPANAAARQDLEHVLTASDRAATLTRQLLNFSRRDTIRPARLAIANVMDELVAMVRPCLPESIDLQVTVRDGETMVDADPNLLQQVLMNLCVNARDAMDSVGTLTITAREVQFDMDGPTPNPNLGPGKYLEISVTDTGTGIPEEIQPRIFDPFFTTKDVGKGTGMGLAMVFGVVEQHGGCVQVESQPGMGAMFRIYLPLFSEALDETEKVPPLNFPSVGGTELILVAEDNPVVRDVVVRILEASGYRTLTAEDGEEAVDQFSLHADEIDLLLFDVVMPKMGGKEAAATIRLIRPEIPAAFCTAYDAECFSVVNLDRETTFIVEKPFNRDRLLQTVRAALDSRCEHGKGEGELLTEARQ